MTEWKDPSQGRMTLSYRDCGGQTGEDVRHGAHHSLTLLTLLHTEGETAVPSLLCSAVRNISGQLCSELNDMLGN